MLLLYLSSVHFYRLVLKTQFLIYNKVLYNKVVFKICFFEEITPKYFTASVCTPILICL